MPHWRLLAPFLLHHPMKTTTTTTMMNRRCCWSMSSHLFSWCRNIWPMNRWSGDSRTCSMTTHSLRVSVTLFWKQISRTLIKTLANSENPKSVLHCRRCYRFEVIGTPAFFWHVSFVLRAARRMSLLYGRNLHYRYSIFTPFNFHSYLIDNFGCGCWNTNNILSFDIDILINCLEWFYLWFIVGLIETQWERIWLKIKKIIIMISIK